jgi:hypothetical protein
MATVTCETENCGNAGVPIDIPLTWADDNGETTPVDSVVCGVCGQEITHIENDERQPA